MLLLKRRLRSRNSVTTNANHYSLSLRQIIMNLCSNVINQSINFRGFEGSPVDAESSDEEDGSSKNTEKSKIPRKRFPWTDEAKYVTKNISPCTHILLLLNLHVQI